MRINSQIAQAAINAGIIAGVASYYDDPSSAQADHDSAIRAILLRSISGVGPMGPEGPKGDRGDPGADGTLIIRGVKAI